MEGGTKMFANILAVIGSALANVATTASLWGLLDEPECPESLIK